MKKQFATLSSSFLLMLSFSASANQLPLRSTYVIKAIETADDPGKSNFIEAKDHLDNGNLAGAILNLKVALASAKNVYVKYEIYKLMALCYLKDDDIYNGKAYLNKVKQILPGLPVNKTYSKSFIDELSYDLSSISLEGYRLNDLSIPHETNVIKLMHMAWAIKVAEEKDVFYAKRGGYYYDKKEYSKALTDYTSAIKLKPEDWNYLLYRAMIFDNLNSPKSAIIDRDKIFKIFQSIENQRELDDHETEMKSYQYLFRGYSYLELNLCEKALADFATACNMGRENACSKTCS